MTRHTLHTELGRKLPEVTVVIKALGLLADFFADKFHKAKEMVGAWVNGDVRRFVYADPLGMHAANFMTFSTGIGSYAGAKQQKYLWDFPGEWQRLVATGIIEMLPRTKQLEERPIHQYDAKFMGSVGMIVDANLPKYQAQMAELGDYMHEMMLAAHPLEQTYKECLASWNQYQRDWWKMGFDHPYTPYPYTWEMIQGWHAEYQRTGVGPISLAEKKAWMEMMEFQQEEHIANQGAAVDIAAHKQYWIDNCLDSKRNWKVSRNQGGGG
jgi:hypothetical protein